jgi:hypothetical protein
VPKRQAPTPPGLRDLSEAVLWAQTVRRGEGERRETLMQTARERNGDFDPLPPTTPTTTPTTTNDLSVSTSTSAENLERKLTHHSAPSTNHLINRRPSRRPRGREGPPSSPTPRPWRAPTRRSRGTTPGALSWPSSSTESQSPRRCLSGRRRGAGKEEEGSRLRRGVSRRPCGPSKGKEPRQPPRLRRQRERQRLRPPPLLPPPLPPPRSSRLCCSSFRKQGPEGRSQLQSRRTWPSGRSGGGGGRKEEEEEKSKSKRRLLPALSLQPQRGGQSLRGSSRSFSIPSRRCASRIPPRGPAWSFESGERDM